ncbi:testis-expressed protein 10 homolog isoform X1 [Periplaneta americana]|uniref:testis-expressed protein 10 homolog isoform X1 n=1 Tax=Periplaneta americana TaxID=6978 RepID=UPI0037E86E94
MARKQHKKHERKEKSKVKLKTKKTVLTKAQNITDARFKIRKIVLPDQLKTTVRKDSVIPKRHNVKELLSKLRHHNLSMRKESLAGLHELVTHRPEEIFGLYLAAVIEGVSELVIDLEKDVRREALKLLQLILTQVPPSKMLPFFNVLLSYLRCGMTHLKASVQNDSLEMLDILLASAPNSVAVQSVKILPNFLNMISHQNADLKHGCVLKVNLNSKFTSVKWYVKVLTRLHGLMSAVVAYKQERTEKKCGDSSRVAKMSSWKNDDLWINLLNSCYKQTCDLSSIFNVGSNTYQSGSIDVNIKTLKEYASSLTPVLMEIWCEVSPASEKNADCDAESSRQLSEESAELLTHVLEVFRLLCEILADEDAEFISAYKKDLASLFFRHFPYLYTKEQEDGMKSKKKKKKSDDEKNLRMTCLTQNLTICQLYFCYHMHHDDMELCMHMLKYLKLKIKHWRDPASRHQIKEILTHLFLKRSSVCSNCDRNVHIVMDRVIRICMSNHDPELFQLLSDISETPRKAQLHRFQSFESWIKSLPDLLCEPVISARTLHVLEKFACQNNPVFQVSLCQKLPKILNNLSSVVINDTEEEYASKENIINILYWVRSWPQDAMDTLRNILLNSLWEKELFLHLRDLLLLRGLILE